MTTQEMLDWFDLIQDKTDSPYFDEIEKLQFLNRAQMDYLATFVNTTQGFSPQEFTSQAEEILRPLIEEIVVTPTDGVVTIAEIEAELNALNRGLYHIMELNLGGKEISFVRHNDRHRLSQNAFKAPSDDNRRYRYNGVGIQIEPATNLPVGLTVISVPADMNASGQNCELADIYNSHNQIVAIALDYAGISVREGEFLQQKQITKPQP